MFRLDNDQQLKPTVGQIAKAALDIMVGLLIQPKPIEKQDYNCPGRKQLAEDIGSDDTPVRRVNSWLDNQEKSIFREHSVDLHPGLKRLFSDQHRASHPVGSYADITQEEKISRTGHQIARLSIVTAAEAARREGGIDPSVARTITTQAAYDEAGGYLHGFFAALKAPVNAETIVQKPDGTCQVGPAGAAHFSDFTGSCHFPGGNKG